MNSSSAKCECLLAWFEPFTSCAVAFSGGVDSVTVAKAAQLALGEGAVAVIADSPSLASGELEMAQTAAKEIGIRLDIIRTEELANPNYVRNATDRCFFCKDELYTQLQNITANVDCDVIINGANADDQGDWRPGMRAADEHGVRSPLLECGFTKADVREIAAHWKLPVWNKPASPCLSSRIAYGEEVTAARLQMIDQAEAWLRERGFDIVRVRYHRGDLARVEVPIDQVAELCQAPLREQLSATLTGFGFSAVTVDLAGFRSGNLNQIAGIPTAAK
ncbi:MAG: ATP-dependent sacrificial sulfur transferase LarE [bacterium]|nr:ATP-dependent sacrificial sulfur transferase LarE [bacterium]